MTLLDRLRRAAELARVTTALSIIIGIVPAALLAIELARRPGWRS